MVSHVWAYGSVLGEYGRPFYTTVTLIWGTEKNSPRVHVSFNALD